MKTTKVKTVETYKDSQGEHIVCKGKLVLVECKSNDDIKSFLFRKENSKIIRHNGFSTNKVYMPIIISETEEIEVGDSYLNYGRILVRNKDDQYPTGSKKILVLSEQFTKAHLQAIVDGKIKSGDEVYVECEEEYLDVYTTHDIIKFTNNHVKLFPVKKEESWDDIFHKYWNEPTRENTGVVGNFKEWFQANYNPPTRKK